ncbi:hypothetical protein [Streptomyces bangladeshensis]|uniref:hypothetical protein n=1 Tax=Streptomyces bangladeshensis TaxID=295352 RepID=UPI0031F9201C
MSVHLHARAPPSPRGFVTAWGEEPRARQIDQELVHPVRRAHRNQVRCAADGSLRAHPVHQRPEERPPGP